VIVVIRGGGDLASGVALRLFRCGYPVVITELERPLVVRRTVSFAEAVYQGHVIVEDVHALRVANVSQVFETIDEKRIPVLVDPVGENIDEMRPNVLIDARLLKISVEDEFKYVPMRIGLGPGFMAGENCNAVVETVRGPFLGRVYWSGAASPDTGIPERVGDQQEERVLRAPSSGEFRNIARIGQVVQQGQPIALAGNQTILAPFTGLIRGLMHDMPFVNMGEKIGDIDPRLDERLCHLVSDKALAVGGGVLEAMLSSGYPPQG